MKAIHLLTADNHGDYKNFKKIVEQVKKDYKGCDIKIHNLGDYNDHWENEYFSIDGREYVSEGGRALEGNHYFDRICFDKYQLLDEELKTIEDKEERIKRFNEKYKKNVSREHIIFEFNRYVPITADNGVRVILLHNALYDLGKHDVYTAYGYNNEETRLKHIEFVNKIIAKENPTYIVQGHVHDPREYPAGHESNWYGIRVHAIGSAGSHTKRDTKTNDINYAIIDENGTLIDKVL